MKRNKNDKRGNGFWWLVVIMCTDFGGIHLVDMRPYGCFILFELEHPVRRPNLETVPYLEILKYHKFGDRAIFRNIEIPLFMLTLDF